MPTLYDHTQAWQMAARMSDFDEHAALAGEIQVNDIASNQRNREFLQWIKNNDKEFTDMWLLGNDSEVTGEDDEADYRPTGSYELGWLGYYLGKNTQLKHLRLGALDTIVGDMEQFFRGLRKNSSIQNLTLSDYDVEHAKNPYHFFSMLTPCLSYNKALTKLNFHSCCLGDEGSRLLSVALGECRSLTDVELNDCQITDDQSVTIIQALGKHSQLQSITLKKNSIGRVGCIALAQMFQCQNSGLAKLDLGRNAIDDEGVKILMPALAKSTTLRELGLAGHPSITSDGFRALSSLLESSKSKLEKLCLANNNVCDKVMQLLASSLSNNTSLKTLNLVNSQAKMTEQGWSAFSLLLCNKTSIKATYQSNHTLRSIAWQGFRTPMTAKTACLLQLNRTRVTKPQLAMSKILALHDVLNMQPLFEWDFKMLPYMIEWFGRAAKCPIQPKEEKKKAEPRKLSAIYQFIRGMPTEYIETRLVKELDAISISKKRLLSQLEDVEQQERQREAVFDTR